MATVLLKELRIENLGPIGSDTVSMADFTFFIGRNNAGKSHYVRAIELMLAGKAPSSGEIAKLQRDPEKEILIEGRFCGVSDFTHLIGASNHADAVERALSPDGELVLVRTLGAKEASSALGIRDSTGEVQNPAGLQTNLLKIVPEAISIPAQADTTDELKNTQSTALSKLKREVLGVFFEELKEKTQSTLAALDTFLHGTEPGERSQKLIEFEDHLKEELMGEFGNVVPTIEFGLPSQEVIAKEMKIFLDDGHRSEVEQKGHGLQRAALLALLRVLAKHGERYHDRPTPIFLIGELESFLHPYAQMQFGRVLMELVGNYQIVATTHSPFIISEKSLAGYRRVTKGEPHGSRAVAAKLDQIDVRKVEDSLRLRGNLEGLFADRIVLVEGPKDQGCYERLIELFDLEWQRDKLTMLAYVAGKSGLWPMMQFYRQMGLDDVAVIADLDYLFCNESGELLGDLGCDPDVPSQLRSALELKGTRPSLDKVREAVEAKGRPVLLDETIEALERKRVFVIRDGAPETYFVSGEQKDGWRQIDSEDDLTDPAYLRRLLTDLLGR